MMRASSRVFLPPLLRWQVQVFDVESGTLRTTLRAHFGTVTACVYHPHFQELYTGAPEPVARVSGAHPGSDGALQNCSGRACECCLALICFLAFASTPASHDGNLLAWTPSRAAAANDDDEEDEDGGLVHDGIAAGAAWGAGGPRGKKARKANVDAWSDEEEDDDFAGSSHHRGGPRMSYR